MRRRLDQKWSGSLALTKVGTFQGRNPCFHSGVGSWLPSGSVFFGVVMGDRSSIISTLRDAQGVPSTATGLSQDGRVACAQGINSRIIEEVLVRASPPMSH